MRRWWKTNCELVVVESASSGGELAVAEDLAVEESWRWQSGGGEGELAAVVESWQWWRVGNGGWWVTHF